MLVASLIVTLSLRPQSGGEVELHPAEAQLVCAGRTVAPKRVLTPATPGLMVGPYFVSGDQKTLSARELWTQSLAWSVELEAGEKLRLLLLGEATMYFSSSTGGLLVLTRSNGHAERVDVGKLLKADPRERDVPMELVESGSGLVLASRIVDAEEPFGDALAWRVTHLAPDLASVTWSRRLTAESALGKPSAFLFAAREPYQVNGAAGLEVLGDDVLFADAQGTVLRLDGATGTEEGRLERIWEFERGFVGPSVWCHCLARFGQCDAAPDGLTKARAAFESERVGFLLDAPLVVTPQRILVIAARLGR